MKEKSKQLKFNYPLYDTIADDCTDITALYLRVSTDTQAQEGYGLDVQYNALYRYCSAYDIANPVIFIDDGYTGVNDNRPAFQKMLSLMKKGKIRLIIAYSLDRIGRTQMLILKFLKEDCEKAKCDFYAVKDNVDSRSKTTYGILISILSIFAEFDHDAIVQKLTLGRKQRAIEGYWKGGGIPPYGYIYSKKANNLVVDTEKAKVVKKIFDMYTTGKYSPMQIAETLGLSSDVVVFGILKNRTYLGEITFKGEQYQGKHEPLIDPETFAKAQEVLNKRKTQRGDSHYLLSSLLFCGNCGAKMRYMKWGKGKNQRLKILCYSKYASTNKKLIKDPNCPNMIYDAEDVEEVVEKALLDFAVKYTEEIKTRTISEDDIIDGMQRKAEGLQTEYKRLIGAYAKIGDEEILNQAAELKKQIESVNKDIREEKINQSKAIAIADNDNLLKTLPDTWAIMTAIEKQKVVQQVIQKVVLGDNEIKIYFNKTMYEKTILGEY